MEQDIEVIENEIIDSRMKDIDKNRAEFNETFKTLSPDEQEVFMKNIYMENEKFIEELELNTIDEDGETDEDA